MKKLFLLSILLVCTTHSFADEVGDAIKQATELYKSGNSAQAVTQLEYAAQLIREQRGEALKQFLPAALSGWTAEDAESESAGAAMFGGGTSVSKQYYKGDDISITITLTADSPMLQSVMMMFSNPMLLQGQGAKMKMIKGQQVIFTDGEAMVAINNTYLVQVEKSSDEEVKGIDADVLAYVEKIDFAGVASFK